ADHLAPLGLNRSFVILDTEDQATLIKQAIRSLNLDEKQYRPATIQGMISRAKNDLLGPEQMAEQAAKYIEEVAARVYKAYEKVLRFERDFPHTRIIMLEQNYRSTQTILDAAQNVVRRNRLRKDKKLWTALGSGEKIVYHEAHNEEEEGLFVAREISRLLARG